MPFQDMRRLRSLRPQSRFSVGPPNDPVHTRRPVFSRPSTGLATNESPLGSIGSAGRGAASTPRPEGGRGGRPGKTPAKASRAKMLIAGSIVLALAFGTFVAWHLLKQKKDSASNHSTSQQATKDGIITNDNTITMLATGDFIAHDSVNAAAQKSDGGYDYLPLMTDFKPLFQKTDIRFCNDPILNGGKQFGIVGYPKFNSPTEFVTDMGRLGCNLVNTASNHSFDKTQDVISASVNAWDTVPNMLAVAGENRSQAEHDTIHYFTVKGVKFAFLAYTTYSNTPPQNSYGVNIFSQDLAKQQVAAARNNGAQAIIVSMRWGTEYSGTVNAAQKQAAQFLADQGVDVVLGHGPHVLQTASQITGSGGNKTTVWYSLGNFINSQIPPETVFNGVALMDYNKQTKQFTNFRYLPIYMHYEWTAKQATDEDLLARHALHLYLFEDATAQLLESQQLNTTLAAQKQRIQQTLNEAGMTIPLITAKDY